MAIMNFNTANQSYRQLVGNGLIYSVPKFQRDYSWTEEEWDDLWEDIDNMLAEGDKAGHYMGYLVLQSEDNKHFDIIDGQQRMTTLSILMIAVLSVLNDFVKNGIDADRNRKRLEQLRGSFIGYLDPVTLVPRSKLNLNRNNNNLYQNYLIPLVELPRRNLKATEHLMRKAYDWFKTKVVKKYSSRKEGADLARFVDQLADGLFFTVITVTDQLNAYTVFETLNARGVKLSSTDLLKNYLFSLVHKEAGDDSELNNLEQRWEQLVGKLGSESFPDFLRVHWNSKNRFVRHAELFKRIREVIQDRGAVFNLLRNMELDADVYVAFSNPADEIWVLDQEKYISELRMFNVRQMHPMLLSAYKIFSEKDFTDLLRAVSIISFRYNVIGRLAPNEQERVYNTVALQIAKGELTNFAQVIRNLHDIYPNDEQFKAAFAEKELRTTHARSKRIVKYILFAIEEHLSGIANDFDSPGYSIEHILPENPNEDWSEFSEKEKEQFVYRLGNMIPLKANINKKIGNIGFALKRPHYEAAEFQISKRIAAENDTWTPERIALHQRWMAGQATSIWRVNQLS